MYRNSWRKGTLAATVMMLLLGVIFSLTAAPTPTAYAQFVEPTATPRDPVWLGFSAARDAIEEANDINLDIVLRWGFFQDEWTAANTNHPERAAGIDSCDSTIGINQARESYFGWTFQITDTRN